jgi:hypothetical protein
MSFHLIAKDGTVCTGKKILSIYGACVAVGLLTSGKKIGILCKSETKMVQDHIVVTINVTSVSLLCLSPKVLLFIPSLLAKIKIVQET